jgi:hypothetical protein
MQILKMIINKKVLKFKFENNFFQDKIRGKFKFLFLIKIKLILIYFHDAIKFNNIIFSVLF